MLTKTYLSNVTLISRMIQIYEDTRSWSRRLSIDTVKQNSRQLAKLSSGNALIVFDTLITNAKSYRNMIEAQVQTLSTCNELSLDIMAYTLVRHLCDSTSPSLDNEANIS